MVVQPLEVAHSSFVEREQVGRQTVRSEERGLSVQPEIRCRVGAIRALSPCENTIGDNLQAQAILSQHPLSGQRNNQEEQ